MLLKKTNIEKELSKTRLDHLQQDAILNQVRQILNQENESEKRITKNIEESGSEVENKFVFDLLETKNIYHISQIKQICINYRLRFLDSKYFKGAIPQEAIDKIKKLEQEHELELKGFKIIAPSKLFKLEDKDDPLLFAPIGNGYYYLIHKWGTDMHPLRKALVWPFKNVGNLLALILLLSLLCTAAIPENLFSKSNTNAQFLVLFFFMFKSAVGVTLFYGVSMGKIFNPAIWNSNYFNA